MKVGIVGLGLIGGSLGLDLRSRGLEVLGVSRRRSVCEIARDRGAVDEASVDLALLQKADVIFICTPLSAIAPTVQQLIPLVSSNTILTDVGSVKQSIAATCSKLSPNFVGGHPMAGTAEQGIEAAQANLFAGAPYVLTPTETTPATALKVVEDLVGLLDARLYICSPARHDRAVAFISHLPLFASAGLIQTCLRESDSEVLQLAQKLASSGFRDTSRIGGGNPELGVAIARHNRLELARSLRQYRQVLDTLIEEIEGENWDAIEQSLQENQGARPDFLN
ncbi:prephenate/arogenate dehydrogenase [Oscillatoria sp. FACHB-1406]|uniref:prephenate/arogenate dehydrogenase n=1 Tax=Oscillatoria sp. FACHB-1406 TaxID=2692846 RepID=UPI0016855793|nr:prephenate/arogenate dehydrogenase [Oscillatoria sp. FACHB-1406]MBD2578484.1 prephenate/arogenate dehydrogenase [Oscillatoria sp. FACHB-1406]